MAATVTGTILNADGTPRYTLVTFEPLTTPLPAGATLITTVLKRAWTSPIDGTFSVTLEEGDYTWKVGGQDDLMISVPNGYAVDSDAFDSGDIAAGGSGYSEDDLITLTGGTALTAAVIKVLAVDGGGAVTDAEVQTAGVYTVQPSNPVAQGSVAPSGGSGATFTLSWLDFDASHNVNDLLTDAPTYNYTAPAPGSEPIATASVSGKVKTDVTESDPVVVTLTTLNDRYGFSPMEFGAVANGITDDTAAFLLAIAAAKASLSKVLDLGSGGYKVSSLLDVSGLRVIGRGAVVIGDGTDYALVALGSAGTYRNLDSDATPGTRSIESATLAGEVVAGDLVKIISSADFSAAESGDVQGEMHVVQSVSGSTITLQTELFDSYTTANTARAAKVTPTTFQISGVTIRQPDYHVSTAPLPRGLRVDFALRPEIDVRFENCQERALTIQNCYAPEVDIFAERCFFTGTVTSYGVAILDATMFARVRGTILGCRHAVTIGGGGATGGVSWESLITVAGSSQSSSTAVVFDAHANTGSAHFVDCVAIGSTLNRAVALHARRFSVRNLTVLNCGLGAFGFGGVGDDIHEAIIDGVNVVTPVTGANKIFTHTQGTIRRLAIRNIVGSAVNYAVDFGPSATVTAIETIENVVNLTGGVLQAQAGSTLPARFVLDSCRASIATPSSTIRFATFLGSTVTDIELRDCRQAGCTYLVQCGEPIERLLLNNCTSDTPDVDHVLVQDTFSAITFIGGHYSDSDTSARRVLSVDADGDVVTFIGVATDGANMTSIVGGAGVTGRLDLAANNFHVSVGGGASSSTSIKPPLTGLLFRKSTGTRVSHTLSQNIGASPMSLIASVRIPTANPSEEIGILKLSSSQTTVAANAFSIGIDSSGQLTVRLYGATTSDHRSALISGFRAAYSGQVIRLEVIRDGATLTIRVDGQSAAYTVTTGGTPPADFADPITSTYFNIGNFTNTGAWDDDVYQVLAFNRALTDAELENLQDHAPEWNDRYGSMTAITSATLTIGRRYRIASQTDGDFTTIGAADSAVGTEFIATTDGTGVIDAGDTVIAIGCLLDPDLAVGFGAIVPDRAGNADGVVAGTITHIVPVQRDLLVWDPATGQGYTVKAGANDTGPGSSGRALYVDNA